MTIAARKVSFDTSKTPLTWVPGDPHTTHVIDVLHLLLPPGERWFCRVLHQVLPEIDDPAIRADVDGFIRQEGSHARAHQLVLEHLAAHGLDATPYVKNIEWLCTRVLGDRPGVLRRPWLHFRVSLIAAIEHFTSVLGIWIVEHDELDRAGADRQMLELLRWHGAEEVEHRSVAFDAARALGQGYVRRQLAMAIVAPVLFMMWVTGTRFLMHRDPELVGGRGSFRELIRAGRRQVLPTLGHLLRATMRYAHPRFHPSRDGSTERALAYLNQRVAA